MAEYVKHYDRLSGHFHPIVVGGATHVAVPVDEYAALIRARDVLANPEQLAVDILTLAAEYPGHLKFFSAVVDCLRRAAAGPADGGTVDDGPVQH
jgi:hypothetical protein